MLLLRVVHEIAEVTMMFVFHVNSQMPGACENGLTFLTHEALVDASHRSGSCGFFTMHSLLVPAEMIVACEIFRTVSAMIGLEFRVNQGVTR